MLAAGEPYWVSPVPAGSVGVEQEVCLKEGRGPPRCRRQFLGNTMMQHDPDGACVGRGVGLRWRTETQCPTPHWDLCRVAHCEGMGISAVKSLHGTPQMRRARLSAALGSTRGRVDTTVCSCHPWCCETAVRSAN